MKSSSRDHAHTATGATPDGAAANESRNAEIVRLRRKGGRPREIARRLGLSANVVAGVLKRAGLVDQSQRRGGWNNPMPDELKARAVAIARAEGRNRAARACGIAHDSVSRWLREARQPRDQQVHADKSREAK